MSRARWLGPWIVVFTIAAGAILGSPPARALRACGYERWNVKTLMDPAARYLSHASTPTTLAALLARRAPSDPDNIRDRDAPVETTLWRIEARLVGYRIEADRDLHLILRDPDGRGTMAAEIPSPACGVAAYAATFASARRAVDRIGGHAASRRWWWLDYRGATPPLVSITGYGFFDRIHRVAGQARNGIELHPVLRVQKV